MPQRPRRTRIPGPRALVALGLSLLPLACGDVEIDGRSAAAWFSDFDNPVVTVRSKASVALQSATPLPVSLASDVSSRFDSPFRDVRHCAVKLAVNSASAPEFREILIEALWAERIQAEQFDEVFAVLTTSEPDFENTLIEAARTKPTVIRRAIANDLAASQLSESTVIELIRRLAKFHGQDRAIVRTIVPRFAAIGEPLRDLSDFLIESREFGASSAEVAEALAAIGGDQALQLLLRQSTGNTPEPWVRGLAQLAQTTPFDETTRGELLQSARSNLKVDEASGSAADLLAAITSVDDLDSDPSLTAAWIRAAESSTRTRRQIVNALVRTLASDFDDSGLDRFIDALHGITEASTRSTFVRSMQEHFDEPTTIALYERLRSDERPREELCDFLFSMWWPTTRLEGPRLDLRELLRDPELPRRAQRCRQLLNRVPSWLPTLWNESEDDIDVLTGCLLGIADAVKQTQSAEPEATTVSEEFLVEQVTSALDSDDRELRLAALRFAFEERPALATIRTSDLQMPRVHLVLLDSLSRQDFPDPSEDHALLVLAANPEQFAVLLPTDWLERPGTTHALNADGTVLGAPSSLNELPAGTIALWRDLRMADELPEDLIEGATAPVDFELVQTAIRP
ncbi:MAG: hypothetical protein AAF196_07100 [Planctomycetota bacterium]